ncbi:MAG: DUF4102 domain-containing protein, partial [Gammaproteobacteria bacterium]|nr:DUF4102 domain-containing protein [Gammaproteobacteria bacterium]
MASTCIRLFLGSRIGSTGGSQTYLLPRNYHSSNLALPMSVKLTELQAKNAKPREAKYTMAGGHGLTLLVMPDGSKYWRLRYRFGGKRRMIGLGKPYPDTTLKQAQAKAAEFRALVNAGIDPGDKRRVEKLAERGRAANTFGDAADAWHSFRSKAWDIKTAEQARTYLDKDVLPKLRSRPLDSITP